MTIIAAADGSALGNPGPAGWGWYVDASTWAAGGWKRGTNNQGELVAVLDLLRQTAHTDEPLEVFCDSQYVINSLTKWMPGWKRKGWKKADGKPVLNVEIMHALDAELAGREVTFRWVKGHAGHELNELADGLANSAAKAYAAGETATPGPGYPGATSRSGTGPQPADAAEPASPGAGGSADAGGSAAGSSSRQAPSSARSGSTAGSAPRPEAVSRSDAPATSLFDDAARQNPRVAAVLDARPTAARSLHPDFRALGGGRPRAGVDVVEAWSPSAECVLVSRADGALEVWVPAADPERDAAASTATRWQLAAVAGTGAR